MKKNIAIIGAGIAGLTLANRLHPHANVIVFEKSRGVGGRMATRQAEPFRFDHGTQFFTVRDRRFEEFLAPHRASGLIQAWQGKAITFDPEKKVADRLWFEPHYVACPGMNSLCKKMAEDIQVELQCEVAPPGGKTANGWALHDTGNRSLGHFDLVISTAPPVQTCRLFEAFLPPGSALRHSKMLACFTLMFGLNRKWDKPWIAAKINNSPLEWIAINSTKPGRDHERTTIVVNSTNAWAEQHVDDALHEVETCLRGHLKTLLDVDLDAPDYFSLHRWRYALLQKAHDDASRDAPFFDQALQLASVGDWGSKSRIEDVWKEANQLADQVLALYAPT